MSTDIRTSHSPYRQYAGCCPPREYSPCHNVHAQHVREHSPVRKEIHTAPTVVEKVFEKSVVIGAVCAAEQQDHSNVLRVEAEQCRAQMNDYNNLVDDLRALQASFNLLSEENMLMKSEFATRADATSGLVASLRQELEDQQGLLDKTHRQNHTLHEELDMQEDYLANRNEEVNRSKCEIDGHQALHRTLVAQSESQVNMINSTKDQNANSVVQIHDMNHHNDCRSVECNDLTVQVNSLECHQQSLVNRYEDLNHVLQNKTAECQEHDVKLAQCENEINTLNGQILSFNSQLGHLRTLEGKFTNDNSDLQNKNMDEGSRNCQLSSNIHDLSVRIQTAENRVCAMRGELDACKSSNHHSMDGNSNLQGQIASLNNHIRVVTGQNAALTTELNSFVEANECLRNQLDRKARVLEVRERNDAQIAMSTQHIHRSRSPIRVVHHEGPLIEHHGHMLDERVIESRLPVMDRIERTIEHVPAGHRIDRFGCGVACDARSRSPLLHPQTYGYANDISRVSAATPTVHHLTIDANRK